MRTPAQNLNYLHALHRYKTAMIIRQIRRKRRTELLATTIRPRRVDLLANTIAVRACYNY